MPPCTLTYDVSKPKSYPGEDDTLAQVVGESPPPTLTYDVIKPKSYPGEDDTLAQVEGERLPPHSPMTSASLRATQGKPVPWPKL